MPTPLKRTSLVALLMLLSSLVVAGPVSAGEPVMTCASQSWTWIGDSEADPYAWNDPANWDCDELMAQPAFAGPAPTFPNGVGHVANFVDESPTTVDLVGGTYTVGRINFVGSTAYTLTNGTLRLEDVGAATAVIDNSSTQTQVFSLTVDSDENAITFTGDSPIEITTFDSSANKDVTTEVDVTITTAVVNNSNRILKFGDGDLTILQTLDMTPSSFTRQAGGTGTYRIEATGPTGRINHFSPDLTLELAPAGPGTAGTLNPRLNPPSGNNGNAMELTAGARYEVDLFADGSSDLIDADGKVTLEQFVGKSEEPQRASLAVNIVGNPSVGTEYVIVTSEPDPDSNGDFAGLVHPCALPGEGSVHPTLLHAVCGEFDGLPDNATFPVVGGYTLQIDYRPMPEVQSPGTTFRGSTGEESDVNTRVVLKVTATPPPPDGGTPPPPPPPPPPLPPAQEIPEPERLGGDERIETSVVMSQEAFGDGAADAVVVARQDIFADAVTGTPLAANANGPVLLTSTDSLVEIVAEEIERVLTSDGTIYIMGGVDALTAEVEADLVKLGFDIERIAGVNRFETATLTADRLVNSGFAQADEALLADGGDFVPATVAGPAAVAVEGVVLLTSGSTMPPETSAWLADHPGIDVTAIGDAASDASPDSTAVTGDDEPDLSVEVAEAFFGAPPAIGVATFAAFADPLTGGTHVALNNGPLLLSTPDALPSVVADYITSIAGSVEEVFIYGGTGALSEDVATDVEEALAAGLE